MNVECPVIEISQPACSLLIGCGEYGGAGQARWLAELAGVTHPADVNKAKLTSHPERPERLRRPGPNKPAHSLTLTAYAHLVSHPRTDIRNTLGHMLPLILLAAAGSAAALQVTSPVAGVQWTVGQPASINWIVSDFFWRSEARSAELLLQALASASIPGST